MRTIALLSLLLIFSGSFAQNAVPQNVAWINYQELFSNMPEYAAADAKLQKLSSAYQDTLNGMYDEIKAAYNKYTEEESILSDKAKKEEQDKIFNLEDKAKNYKNKIFGRDGKFSKLQDELMNPIHSKLKKIIEEVAKSLGYSGVFDYSGSGSLIWHDERFDITEKVRAKL